MGFVELGFILEYKAGLWDFVWMEEIMNLCLGYGFIRMKIREDKKIIRLI